jgi:flagellar FliL protein
MSKAPAKEAEHKESAEGDDGHASSGGKKKLIILIAAAVLLIGGGVGLYMSGIFAKKEAVAEDTEHKKDEHAKDEHAKDEKPKDDHAKDEKPKDEHGKDEQAKDAKPAKGAGKDVPNPVHTAPGGIVFYDLPDFLVNLNTGTPKSSFLKVSVTLELADANSVPQIEGLKPRIVDSFQTYLRELRPADLRGSAGMYRLREELLLRVNKAVQPAIVNDILFKEMIVQ